MRCLFGFLCVCALGVMGCGEYTCAAACISSIGNVQVSFDPWVRSTYDVALVLDGASGAFTCEGGNAS